jgi:hypothetical protein
VGFVVITWFLAMLPPGEKECNKQCTPSLLQIPPRPEQIVSLNLKLTDHWFHTRKSHPFQCVDAFLYAGQEPVEDDRIPSSTVVLPRWSNPCCMI